MLYNSSSGTLPSDYGLLPRNPQHNNDTHNGENNESTSLNSPDDSDEPTCFNFQAQDPLNGRVSLTGDLPPCRWVKLRSDKQVLPVNAGAEREPLLGQTPRILENGTGDRPGESESEVAMWWHEVSTVGSVCNIHHDGRLTIHHW